MGIMSAEYRDRLRHWVETLKKDLYHPIRTLDFEGFTTMEYLTPEEASQRRFEPIEKGYVWGHEWEYLWLRTKVVVPQEAEGEMLVMNLDFAGEATLFVNGQAFGTRRADWVRSPIHLMSDNFLTEKAVAGESFDLLFEVYAGHFIAGNDGCATGPVLPGTLVDPLEPGKRRTMGSCTVGVWNEDAYQLLLDVQVLEQVMNGQDESSLRAAELADGLEGFTLCVDFEQDAEARKADYRRARELLRPLLEAKNGDTAPMFYAVGNSHLDLAWLWPMQETERKTARTFGQQLRLLEKYPEYRYLQSQPASYQMCKEHYPELYERIREAIREGRWIADGAMYVEPDTNMPSGEALIRQLVHGKRFYQEELGVESQVLWLPDTFGYSAALPQILQGCGVKYLVTQKIFWSYNDGDPFPYHYFQWRGMDGCEVTAFLPTSYTYDTRPEEVRETWEKRRQKRHLTGFLYPFGYGDGGGGPTRDHIENVRRTQNLEGAPRMKMVSPLGFFEEMERTQGKPVNTWCGELYFSCHRGTYTAQSRVKRNNRRSEIALHQAEFLGTLAALRGGWAYPMADMDRLWKQLLLNQFHDILPGSSIGRVYEEANAAHQALQAEAEQIAHQAMDSMTGGEGITVFNSLCFARKARIALPDQREVLVEVPALGMVSIQPEATFEENPQATARLTGDGAVLENAMVCVRLNGAGEIVSLVRKATGREFVHGRMNELRLYKDVPRLFDAWDIDSCYIEQPVVIETQAVLTVARECGLYAAIRVERRFEHSSFTQEIVLPAYSERVDFHSTVDWHEQHRLLKAAFTGTPMALEAEHEVQFGFVKRPTHRSRLYDQDRFEVCNHRYTALHDGGHGFAVLNDCKYGVSVDDQTIGLSLLRGPMAPEAYADQGVHDFTYSLYCWDGAFDGADVTRQGMDLNVPVLTFEGSTETFSLAAVDAPNVMMDTVKPAEDGSGDVVVRLYECAGADTPFTLQMNLPFRAVERVNLLEQEPAALSLEGAKVHLHAHPFEIITLRMKR